MNTRVKHDWDQGHWPVVVTCDRIAGLERELVRQKDGQPTLSRFIMALKKKFVFSYRLGGGAHNLINLDDKDHISASSIDDNYMYIDLDDKDHIYGCR